MTLERLGYRHLEQRWTFWTSPRDEYSSTSRWGPPLTIPSMRSTGIHGGAFGRARRTVCPSSRPAKRPFHSKAFYDIFKNFSVGKGFLARGYEYQRSLWQSYVAGGGGRLFLAKYEGQVIGGLLCILFGRKCVAMHMGTWNNNQKLQSYYAYVWESIRYAKESDCEWYSFRGVGTTPTQEAFKRKFNPQVVALAGYFDYPSSGRRFTESFIGSNSLRCPRPGR